MAAGPEIESRKAFMMRTVINFCQTTKHYTPQVRWAAPLPCVCAGPASTPSGSQRRKVLRHSCPHTQRPSGKRACAASRPRADIGRSVTSSGLDSSMLPRRKRRAAEVSHAPGKVSRRQHVGSYRLVVEYRTARDEGLTTVTMAITAATTATTMATMLVDNAAIAMPCPEPLLQRAAMSRARCIRRSPCCGSDSEDSSARRLRLDMERA